MCSIGLQLLLTIDAVAVSVCPCGVAGLIPILDM